MAKISREYGGWLSTILIFIFSLSFGIINNRDLQYLLIFWVPLILGMVLFDTSFKNILKNAYFTVVFIIISIFAIFSVYLSIITILPYALFCFVYLTRFDFLKLRISYVSTVLGLLGLTISFYVSLSLIHVYLLVLSILLFFYLIGSEFAVRSFLKKDQVLLLYTLIPLFFILLNPFYLIFGISVIRIPLVLKSKKLKYIGIGEAGLLSILISYFVILQILKLYLF